MTTYRNVTSTVTHVMEFTEECLTVFYIYVHALLCFFLVIWHLGQDDKITLILYTCVYIFKVTFNHESWQYVQLSDGMPLPSQRIFSPLTLSILKTIINLQKFSVQSCHNRHKELYTGELQVLLLQP